MDPTPHTTTDIHWSPVPEALLFSGVSDKAIRVYATLLRFGMTPGDCYPSHATLAERIGCAPRSVQRPLRELEAAGWLRRTPRFTESGERMSDGYAVFTEPTAAQENAPTAQENVDPPRAGARTPRAGERDKREPVNESQLTRENSAVALVDATHDSAAPPTFERFWQTYPRKVGKPAAKKAWEKATRRADPEAIIAAAAAYRDWPDRDDAFTKHPGPWLNDDRWDDDLTAKPRPRARPPSQYDQSMANIDASVARMTGRAS